MKLWKILQALSEQEQEYFAFWLKVELDGKHPNCLGLLDSLLVFKEKPNKQEVWESAFPDKPFVDSRFRRAVYEIRSRLRLFLAFLALKENKDLSASLMLRKLNQMNLPDVFEEELGKLMKEKKQDRLPSPSYYEFLYKIHKEIRQHNLMYRSGSKEGIQQARNLHQYFDAWWIHEKFLLSSADNSLGNVYGQTPLIPLMKEADEIIRSHPEYEKMTYLQLLKLVMDFDQRVNPQKVLTVFKRLADQRDKYEEAEFTHIFIFLLNKSVRLFHQSETQELSLLLFTLYKWGIDHRILWIEDWIPARALRAVVHTGLIANEPQEIAQLISDYSDKVLPEERDEIVALCKAKYAFQQGNFQIINSLLLFQKYDDKLTEVESKLLQYQAYYELDPTKGTELEGKLQSLEKFIRIQERISAGYKSRLLTAISIFYRMIKHYKKAPLKKLLAETDDSSPYSLQGWLASRIKEKIDRVAE